MQIESLAAKRSDSSLGSWRRAHLWAAGFSASFRVYAIFFLLTALYLTGYFVVERLTGEHFVMHPVTTIFSIVAIIAPTTLITITIMRLYHIALVVRPEHPIPALVKDVVGFISKPIRLINALPMLVVLALFAECFSSIKGAIPMVKPFSWDPQFAALDRALHFGTDPWQWLQPLLGHWWITLGINIAYNFWFVVVWVSIIAFVFSQSVSRLKLQYLLAIYLSWSIGGSLLAIVFSSAGPVYFDRLGYGTVFEPLVTYLRAANDIAPIWAVATQDMLWAAYETNNQALISGISAMPSMHMTSATLIVLMAWRFGRAARVAGVAFAVAILLGSVHLGWHYAIDSYAGILLAVSFWWFCGWLTDRYFALPFVREARAQLDALT